MNLISKHFCLDDLIPFDTVWFALSWSDVFSAFLLSKSDQGMLSPGEKRRFSYLYYTELLQDAQVLFTKIENFSFLVIKQPIRNIYNPNPLILVLIMPSTGNYHFGVGILDLE